MSRRISIAAVQMDVSPAPLEERLGRAERLASQAARNGAQIVVLPEVFNTGYEYSVENYRRAERSDGPTAAWMEATAARLGIHLAGSLMLREQGEIYNALLLYAPDGRSWRYDKNYPWGWERAYFREGKDTAIAHTSLGDIGLLICWDLAHRNLWRRYAGQVDLMLVCSCPPQITNPTFILPDGKRLGTGQLGPFLRPLKGSTRQVFSEMLAQQTAWLNVPAVQTVGCGRFCSRLPQARNSLALYALAAPWLYQYLPQAEQIQITCEMTAGTRILDANGKAQAECTQADGESFALAEIELSDKHPQPKGQQPPATASAVIYLISDWLLPWLTRRTYYKELACQKLSGFKR